MDPRLADLGGGEGGFYCSSIEQAHRWDLARKNVDILQYFTHFRNEPLYYEKWKVQTFQLCFISIHPMMQMETSFLRLPKLKCQKLKIKTSVKHFSLYLLYIEPLVNSLQVLVKLFQVQKAIFEIFEYFKQSPNILDRNFTSNK